MPGCCSNPQALADLSACLGLLKCRFVPLPGCWKSDSAVGFAAALVSRAAHRRGACIPENPPRKPVKGKIKGKHLPESHKKNLETVAASRFFVWSVRPIEIFAEIHDFQDFAGLHPLFFAVFAAMATDFPPEGQF